MNAEYLLRYVRRKGLKNENLFFLMFQSMRGPESWNWKHPGPWFLSFLWFLQIYNCGGFNGIKHLSTAECFDPRYDQWTWIEPMYMRRSGVGVIALNNQVFAVRTDSTENKCTYEHVKVNTYEINELCEKKSHLKNKTIAYALNMKNWHEEIHLKC